MVEEVTAGAAHRGDHGAGRSGRQRPCATGPLAGGISAARRERGRGDGGFFFDVGAWSETLADSYLALGQVDDAVRVITEATRGGHGEGAEMLCELGEKLMRSGHEPQARDLWRQSCTDFPDDVWIYVQAGIEYGDLGDHGAALAWLTPGTELVLRTGDPESALEQLVPLRAASLGAAGRASDALQDRAEATLAGMNGQARDT